MLFDILLASGSDDWGHGWWIVWPLVWLAVIVGVVWLIRSRRGGPPYVEGVYADASSAVIGRTEVRTARLIAAARAGGHAVFSAFGRHDAHLNEQLMTVDARGNPIDVRLVPEKADV